MLTLLSWKVVAKENIILVWQLASLWIFKENFVGLSKLEFNLKVVDNLSARESEILIVVGFPLKFLTITNK